MQRHFRTGWISDVHLGTKGAQAEPLLAFLRAHEFETLYIVGDLIDVWSLKRGIYWPQPHNDVIQKILRAARKGTKVVYIPGNHDDFIANYHGDFGGVTVVPNAVHTSAGGRRLLVMHGHELDSVVQNIKWLAHLGDIGYQFLLRLNRPLNFVRRVFGLRYWSLSAFVKQKVKGAVNYVGKFEECIARFAKDHDARGVVCGHIHVPCVRSIGDITYYNCGDWVESCSALVEHSDGHLELLTNLHEPADVIPIPIASFGEFDEVARRMGAR